MAKVLVVEDEAIVGLQIQESLEEMGHTVPAVVDSGDEVVAAVMTHRPDIILMDIKLRSFIDGFDAAARLRLISDMPIIYLTAYPSQGSEDRAARTNPSAYLVKPVDDKILRVAIDKALLSRPPSGL